MIQVRGESVLSENWMKRKRLKKKTRSKRHKGSRGKRVRMLERTLIRLNHGERNAKENEKDISKKANIQRRVIQYSHKL